MEKLLLHCCCGPCSLGAIPRVIDEYDVTLYYFNPCIISGEYDKRADALKIVADHFSLPLIICDHDRAPYLAEVKGHEADPERGERCGICIRERIAQAASYAKDNGFDVFTTTLSVSPKKDYAFISACGKAEAERVGVKFLDADFKKKDGFLMSVRLSKELGIYRQNFCGCEFSYDNTRKA